jgi:YidC/Oxa1 family membrane protein insertase
MHIESAEPNLLRSENPDEGGKGHDGRNTSGSGPSAGSALGSPRCFPWLEIHDLPVMESFCAEGLSSRRRAASFICRTRASKRQSRCRWSEMASLLGNIFAPLTGLISGELDLFHSFGAPWWLAIVLLTLSVRGAILPLTLRQVRNMRAMQELRPELERIRSRYRDDLQKQQQKLAELYRERHINPLGGFVALLVQMPIFITLYYTIRSFQTHVPGFDHGGLLWFTDLGPNVARGDHSVPGSRYVPPAPVAASVVRRMLPLRWGRYLFITLERPWARRSSSPAAAAKPLSWRSSSRT